MEKGHSTRAQGNPGCGPLLKEPSRIRQPARKDIRSAPSMKTSSVFLLILCGAHIISFADGFLVPQSIQSHRPPSSPTRLHVASKTEFTSLTVKELKELIKNGKQPLERGVLSKLKKKQDLIDFLEQREENQSVNGEAKNDAHVEQPNGTSPSVPRKLSFKSKSTSKSAPLKMPSLDSTTPDQEELEEEEEGEEGKGTWINPKDRIFQQVFERYPPIREQYEAKAEAEEAKDLAETDDDEEDESSHDIRQIYHPIFQNQIQFNKGCDMDLVFVGTASCTPGTTRGVSCTALRLNWKRRAAFQDPTPRGGNNQGGFQGGTWLFDVGECTQLQVQRTTGVRPSKVTKIFLTHAHGDHTFGLPGLLCLLGQDRPQGDDNVIDIYGPQGLRKWLRVAIRYSVSRIVPPYRVHELMEVPMAPEWEYSPKKYRYFYKGLGKDSGADQRTWGTRGLSGEDPSSWITQAEGIRLDPATHFGEVPGGRDIYPGYGHPLANDDAPVWEVEDEDDVRVYAAPMSHGIPCVGYVVQESSRPGRLRNEIVQPMVQRNLQALKEAGFNIPMKAMAVIKNLPVGSAFTFPDGTSITQEEAVEPPRKGRKVVIMGDTANCRSMEVLAQDCDVLVHEATNAYVPGVDRDTNLRMVTKDAIIHGHSTPEIAGLFAKKVNARRLLLNHFSARYKGDPSVESMSIMMRIEQFAMTASGLDETNVAAAWDLMILPIPSSSSTPPSSDEED